MTQQPVTAQRRRIKVDWDLPMKDEYAAFLRALLVQTRQPGMWVGEEA